MSKFKKLLNDKKLMSGIYAVTLITALLILALVIKGPEESGRLIADRSGNIVGINRNSMKRSERYDLSLKILDKDETLEKDVTITLQAASPVKGRSGGRSSESRDAEIDAAVDSIINTIEYSKAKKISLPMQLPDGTALKWSSAGQKGGMHIFIIPLMYISLVAIMVMNSLRNDGGNAEIRASILRGLPRFCNQLYLMMNAGLILSDAFDTISADFSLHEDDLSLFERDIADLREATQGHRISTAEVLNEYAARYDVKEMIRIAAILTENEKRGSDIIENLARESRYLWDERKTIARESGKAIDTKMSYPLGLLLIVLIVITISPALLNM